MDTDSANIRFHGLFIERIHQLLVVESPGVFGFGGQRITNGVRLPTVGPELVDGFIDLVHPARLPWGDHDMTQHAPGARHAVDHIHGFANLLVGQEPPRLIVERCTTQQRHRGIAVEEDLAHVVFEFVITHTTSAG